MANSAHFKDLQKRISELRRHMLPAKYSPIGDYSERVRDRARGFRVLAHAEIEAYLETIAVESIDDKIALLKGKGKPSYIVISFMASYHAGWITNENDPPIFSPKNGVKAQKTILAAIDKANEQYKSEVVGKNNGIKIANLKSIFLPVGIDFDNVDATWLNTVNSFGKQRGEVAHQAKKAQKQIDPKTEFDTVKQVMDGLKDFDEMVLKLVNS